MQQNQLDKDQIEEVNALIASLQRQRDEAQNMNAQLMAKVSILEKKLESEEPEPAPKQNGKTKTKPIEAKAVN